MEQIQVTLLQLDNYGPWTTTLGNDREHRLQVLQAQIYTEVQKEFSSRGGLAFYNRFDELMAVSNGILEEDHRIILHDLKRIFTNTLSMGIGVGATPFDAQKSASEALRKAGGPKSIRRRGVITGDEPISVVDGSVQIAHFDVNGVSRRVMRGLSAYETSIILLNLHSHLMRELSKKGSLTFFLGGDNFMSVSNGLSAKDYRMVLERIRASLDIGLKCGVGIAKTARKAAEIATTNLDIIRHSARTAPVIIGSDP